MKDAIYTRPPLANKLELIHKSESYADYLQLCIVMWKISLKC